MPVLKTLKNGVWEPVSGMSEHTHSWNDIEDRPFYETDPVETVIVEGTIPSGGMMQVPVDINSLTLGERYKVIFDGTTYDNLVCVMADGLAAIGSVDFSYTDYPFIFAIQGGRTIAVVGNNSTSHSIKVIAYITTVISMERKYIAEHIDAFAGEKVTGKVYTVDDAQVTAGEGAEVFNDYATNIASGKYSHAEGSSNIASGMLSHAEGWSTKATGPYSHAEGYETTASESYSHAEGWTTQATKRAAHAEGFATKANGEYSHAEGDNAVASGRGAHAEGYSSNATGNYSHAEGLNTKASSENQHVQGKYNVEDTAGTYAHIVGNGTTNSKRSNAHTLDWDGNAWFAGEVKIGGTGKDDSNAKTLSTTEYVDTSIANLINSAPSTLDTLGEIATAMEANNDVVEALETAIGTKANASDLTAHTGNTSNPHGVTKAQIGLSNVENKSSSDIRSELTKSNVVAALGYTPPTEDNDSKVKQILASANSNYPLLLAPYFQTETTTGYAYFDSGVYLNPSLNRIYADISGTATNVRGITAGNFLVGNGTDAMVEKTPAEVVESLGINKTHITTPNWNASEGEDGYIANRTHYEGIGEVLLLDTSVTITEGGVSKLEGFMPEIGKTYNVSLDGVRYENLTAFDDDGYVTIGESYNVEADDYVWAEYPFTINDNGNRTRANIGGQTAGDHTLQIYGEDIVVHKLDSKFIHTPNWNASEGEPGYIENRTHYDGMGYVPLYGGIFKIGSNAANCTPIFEVVAGKKYKVVINDDVYELIAGTRSNGYPYLGAPHNGTAYDYSVYPFYFNATPTRVTFRHSVSGTYHVAVYGEAETTHKLDKKYLHTPDWNTNEDDNGHIANRTHYTEVIDTNVLVDTILSASVDEAGLFVDLTSFIEPGKTYRVCFDGVEYIITAGEDDYGYFLGAPCVNDEFDFGEYPFYIYDDNLDSIGIYCKDTGAHTIRVSEFETVVHRLDEKYMPLLTSPNGTKFMLSVSDNGTITATAVT